jgi:hypothetical protein
MTKLMTNLPIGSPEFKNLLTAGLVCVGAEVEYAMSAIKKGAQPGPDDESYSRSSNVTVSQKSVGNFLKLTKTKVEGGL